jgi:SAM-dependent methyltransferase
VPDGGKIRIFEDHDKKPETMFTALINRTPADAGWQKIPWHDPEFSRRMLAEHLNQSHDHASRRFNIIDQQVQWIHRKILRAQPSRILDLGCGPGFYTSRFTSLGHRCTGIDISPASIAYAREHYPGSEYILGDVREVDFGAEYDLVTLIFGELNAFSPAEAEQIVGKAYGALKAGGKLLLEVHPYSVVHRSGTRAPSWHTAQQGLFSDQPYLCLSESTFDGERAVDHYYVYAADSGEMTRYTSMLQGYTDDEYRTLLSAFWQVMSYPSLTGSAETGDLVVIMAEK